MGKTGKSKCRKSRRRRNRPTGIPSVKEIEELDECTETSTESDAVDSILEKLQNCSEDQECTTFFMAEMANDSKFANLLIERDAVKIAAPLMLHSNPSIRYAVLGFLRNVSSSGGETTSERMVRQDVITPLTALLSQYDMEWDPSKSSGGKFHTKKEVFLEACSLLTTLCENSCMALEIFNKNDLLSRLLPHLTLKAFDVHVAIAIVQCLHTVTENNTDAIQKLSHPKRLEVLHSFISSLPRDPTVIHLRMLTAGVLLNLNSSRMGCYEPLIAKTIVEVIDETLQVLMQPDIDRLSDAFLSLEAERRERYREQDSLEKKETAIIELLRNMGHILSAKQVALEALANICCSDDTCDWDETGSNSSMSDEAFDHEDISSIPINVSTNIPPAVRGLMVSKNIKEKLLQQIVFLDQPLMEHLQEGPPEVKVFIKKLHVVRCRALLCANNVIQALDIDDLGGTLELFQLWMALSKLMFTQTDATDNEQLEAASSSVRAVIQKLAECKDCSSHFNQLTETDLKLFFDIHQKTQDPCIKVNIIRSVATVGCIVSSMTLPNSFNLTSVIGAFLTETCVKSSELWVTAEALDAVFDVFAEDHLDVIARELSLVDKLHSLVPVLKSKIKQQKNSLGEHLPVIMTAKTNLLRFLRYKNECT